MVLLVVDAQKQITTSKLYRYDLFAENVKKLIESAGMNNIEVIYIRHDDGAGQELSKGNSGFEIFEAFAPNENEKVFDKTVNSPFRNTGLLEYLNGKHENQIIVVGLQTDYCIDATVKAAPHRDCARIAQSDFSSDCADPAQAGCSVGQPLCQLR